MNSRRRRALAAAWSALGVLGGCALIGSGPTVVTLDEAELTALIGRTFPLEGRLFELFEARAEKPQVALDPGHNRLVIDAAFAASERLTATSWRGRLVFDSALRWDEAASAVRLDHVRVRALDFGAAAGTAARAGAPGAEAIAQRLRAVLAEQLLAGQVVWRLDAERRTRLDRLGLKPGAVTVTARGVEITLVPAP